jgi:hypothetical protein
MPHGEQFGDILMGQYHLSIMAADAAVVLSAYGHVHPVPEGHNWNMLRLFIFYSTYISNGTLIGSPFVRKTMEDAL